MAELEDFGIDQGRARAAARRYYDETEREIVRAVDRAAALRRRRAQPARVQHLGRARGRRCCSRSSPRRCARAIPSGARRRSRRWRTSPRSPRTSSTCCSCATCAASPSERRDLAELHPRHPGLPEARDRLQGHHAAAARRRGAATRRSTRAGRRGRGRASVDFVVAAEARGFILGARWRASSAPASSPPASPGKLPRETVSAEYILEYGVDALEMHADALADGARVLVHDDLLATGGTARALAELVEERGRESWRAARSWSSSRSSAGRERLAPLRRARLIAYDGGVSVHAPAHRAAPAAAEVWAVVGDPHQLPALVARTWCASRSADAGGLDDGAAHRRGQAVRADYTRVGGRGRAPASLAPGARGDAVRAHPAESATRGRAGARRAAARGSSSTLRQRPRGWARFGGFMLRARRARAARRRARRARRGARRRRAREQVRSGAGARPARRAAASRRTRRPLPARRARRSRAPARRAAGGARARCACAEPALPATLPRARWRGARGEADVRDDRDARVLRSPRASSYPDLLRLRAGDVSRRAGRRGAARRAHDEVRGGARGLRARAGVAVVPFGGGTSVVGGVEPLRDGFARAWSRSTSRRLDRPRGRRPRAR